MTTGKGLIEEDGLTAKQRLFVEEYLVDLNAKAAAIRAGYSPNSAADIGYENLRKPPVVDAIGRAMARRAQETSITAKWVLLRLVDAEDKATKVEGVGALPHRLRALELIGKHVDVQAFRHQIGLGGLDGGPVRFDYSGLNDEELEQLERLLAKASPDAVGSEGGEGEAEA